MTARRKAYERKRNIIRNSVPKKLVRGIPAYKIIK